MSASPLRNRLFRQLIAVEDTGSLRKAAEKLNISQPALSKSMQEFEARLGVELLKRGSAGANLTEAGRDITRRGRQILLLVEEIEKDLQQWPQTRKGKICLGAGSGSLIPLTRDVVQPFLSEYPNVDVTMYCRNPRALAKMIESGELDVLVAIDETLEQSDLLIRRPLRRERVSFFVRSGHELLEKENISYEDIIKFRVVSPFITENLSNWFNDKISNINDNVVNYFICHDYNVLCDTLVKSDCIGVATEQMIDYLSENYKITKLPVQGFRMNVLVHCIYRKAHEFSRSTAALIDLIEKKMKNLPG
ncbi:MAG: LysR family transcriptional regulator [Novosphingobium sp.]|nr:LysR family transcriptional regulator [Novosphingobium sp.]